MDEIVIPETMRAWTFTRRGSPVDTLQLTRDHPTPRKDQLQPADVIVKISAVGLNAGVHALFVLFPHLTSKPWIPEMEFSGTVAAVGAAVSPEEFRVGDAVIGSPTVDSLLRLNGVLAEFAVWGKGTLVKKPKALGWEEAAGLPGCATTAVHAMDVAAVKEGGKVLITAGSGALGTQLIQVARLYVGREGEIVTTCSERNRSLVTELGANEVSGGPTDFPYRVRYVLTGF